jgi:hypothetical protein
MCKSKVVSLSKHHNTEMSKGIGVKLYTFLTYVLSSGQWLVSSFGKWICINVGMDIAARPDVVVTHLVANQNELFRMTCNRLQTK